MSRTVDTEEYQKEARVKGFFSHPGWVDFNAEIVKLFDYHNSCVENYCFKEVRSEDLQELNFHIARRACYQNILQIKENMLEEVGVPSPEEDGVKEPLEV